MTSHASRKTKHAPPRLWNSFLIRTLPTVALHHPGPFPSPGPENSSTHKMRATREKSHSQLGGPTSGDTWGCGTPSRPITPGEIFLEGGPSLRTSITWMSRRNISEHTQQRKLHPQRGDQPSVGLLDSNTNTTKSQPAKRGKPCTWRMLGSLGTWGFCSFLSQGFPSPHFLVPILCPWPHSTALGKLPLHTTLPIYLGPGRKGNRRDHSWGNREPRELPRMPRVRVGLFLSGMMDAHAHADTHTPSLWRLHTHPHTQEMIGFVKTHCST